MNNKTIGVVGVVAIAVSIFTKSYWTGLCTIMRFWWKLMKTYERATVVNIVLGLLMFIVLIVVAIKWGFLKAVWCTLIYMFAYICIAVGIGAFEIYIQKKAPKTVGDAIYCSIASEKEYKTN